MRNECRICIVIIIRHERDKEKTHSVIDENKKSLGGEEADFECAFEYLGPVHGWLHSHFVQPHRALSNAHSSEY